VIPCTVYVSGQDTGDDADRTPLLISAAEVITFMVEPGATLAVSAKSLKPALLAMARIFPVDGWMATIDVSRELTGKHAQLPVIWISGRRGEYLSCCLLGGTAGDDGSQLAAHAFRLLRGAEEPVAVLVEQAHVTRRAVLGDEAIQGGEILVS
jgi:hypothetical protein